MFIHSLTDSLTHSFTDVFTHSFIHFIFNSLFHSVNQLTAFFCGRTCWPDWNLAAGAVEAEICVYSAPPSPLTLKCPRHNLKCLEDNLTIS